MDSVDRSELPNEILSQHLQQEFQQAWEHYRHNEVMRTTYMGFFFTIAFGISGSLAIPLMSNPVTTTSSILLITLFLINLIFLSMCSFIFTSVVKFGLVIKSYYKIIQTVRAKYLSLEFSPKLDIYASSNFIPLFSAQKSSQVIIIYMIIISLLFQVFIVIKFFLTKPLTEEIAVGALLLLIFIHAVISIITAIQKYVKTLVS